jgi:hypothetical protein
LRRKTIKKRRQRYPSKRHMTTQHSKLLRNSSKLNKKDFKECTKNSLTQRSFHSLDLSRQ